MGDAAGESADALQPLRAQILLLESPPVRDVGADREHRLRLATGVADQRPVGFGENLAAVAALLHQLAGPLAVLEQLAPGRRLGAGVARQELGGRSAERRVRLKAEDACGASVPVDHSIVEAADEDGVGGRVEEGRLLGEALFALALSVEQQLAIGDVLDGAEEPLGLTVLVGEHDAVSQKVAALAVGAADAQANESRLAPALQGLEVACDLLAIAGLDQVEKSGDVARSSARRAAQELEGLGRPAGLPRSDVDLPGPQAGDLLHQRQLLASAGEGSFQL